MHRTPPLRLDLDGARPAAREETQRRLDRWTRWARARRFEIVGTEAIGRPGPLEIVFHLPPVGSFVLPLRFVVSGVLPALRVTESRANATDATRELFDAVPALMKVRMDGGAVHCLLDAQASERDADALLEALPVWRIDERGYRR